MNMDEAITKCIQAINLCEGAFKEMEAVYSNARQAGSFAPELIPNVESALVLALELKNRHHHHCDDNRSGFIDTLIKDLEAGLDAHTLHPGAIGPAPKEPAVTGVSGDSHAVESHTDRVLNEPETGEAGERKMTDPVIISSVNVALDNYAAASTALEEKMRAAVERGIMPQETYNLAIENLDHANARYITAYTITKSYFDMLIEAPKEPTETS